MNEVYIPLLTYKHANGAEGSEVIPGLAEELPKITNGGKTYTLFLRPGLKYSDGEPVKASDFPFAVERMIKLNSGGSPFYTERSSAPKSSPKRTRAASPASSRRQDRRNRHQPEPPARHLHQRARADVRRAAPAGHADRRPHGEPAPRHRALLITKVQPGKGWEYERNPYWAKANGKAMPELPSGTIDSAKITVIRNPSRRSTTSNRATYDWMQNPPPADRYAEVKEKFEGTQFRVEPTISTYYFWMNTTEPPVRRPESPPGGQLRDQLRRAGTDLRRPDRPAPSRSCRRGCPATKKFDLYPYDVAKAKEMIKEAEPVRHGHHRLDRQRKPEQRSGRIPQRRAPGTRLQHDAENPQRRQLLHGDRQRDDAEPRRRLARLVPGLPAPERLLPAAAWPAKASCRPTTATSPASTIRR